MDQLLRLLRAKCAYCHHLRLHPAEINRFICKLRLIQHGLLEEAKELDDIHLRPKMVKSNGLATTGGMESDQSEEDDPDSLVYRRNDFVKHAIKQAGSGRHRAATAAGKFEAVAEERRAVIKEFLGIITKGKTCGSCKGYDLGFPGIVESRNNKIHIGFRRRIGKTGIARYFESL